MASLGQLSSQQKNSPSSFFSPDAFSPVLDLLEAIIFVAVSMLSVSLCSFAGDMGRKEANGQTRGMKPDVGAVTSTVLHFQCRSYSVVFLSFWTVMTIDS